MKAYKAASRDAAEADHNTAVLYGVVIVKEPCSAFSHLGSLHYSQHLLYGVGSYELHVIVKEEKIFSRRMHYSEIVDGGIIKLSRPSDHLYTDIGNVNRFVIVTV